MEIVCFEHGRTASVGVLSEDRIVDLEPLLGAGDPQAMLVRLIEHRDRLREPIAALCRTEAGHARASVRLRASVPSPGKVLCVMRNRPALDESPSPPWAYLKYAGGGAAGTGETLRLPAAEHDLRLEPELAIVVRGPARDLEPDAWQDAVFGYTAFLDVVRPGSSFGPAGRDDWWKSWDTAYALGPTIVTDRDARAGDGPEISVSGAAATVDARDPGGPPLGEIVAFLSSVMTLRSGDVIACGAHEAAVVAAAAGTRARLRVPGCGALEVALGA